MGLFFTPGTTDLNRVDLRDNPTFAGRGLTFTPGPLDAYTDGSDTGAGFVQGEPAAQAAASSCEYHRVPLVGLLLLVILVLALK